MTPIIFGLIAISLHQVTSQFQTYDEWKTVSFKYDNQTKEQDIKNGYLRPKEVVIFDSKLYINSKGTERLFVTAPNLYNATRFTLSTVSDSKDENGSPLLEPYPNEGWYNKPCNQTITSVYEIKIDRLNRLWVIDSGTVDQLTPQSSIVCPPQILIFDLESDKLIRRYEVPSSQHYSDSLLMSVELDIKNEDGSDTMAYVSDLTGFRMLVYNMKDDSSYPIDNPYFNPFPIDCFFRNINGLNFTHIKGLYSVSIDPGNGTDRLAYFHGLSSTREGTVKMSVIENQKSSADAFSYDISEPRGFHTTAEIVTPNGFLIFGNLEDNSIMVWDIQKEYKPENFVTIAKDDEKFQYISGLQLLGTDRLLVTSNRYQNVINNKIDNDNINYRVLINLNISKFITR